MNVGPPVFAVNLNNLQHRSPLSQRTQSREDAKGKGGVHDASNFLALAADETSMAAPLSNDEEIAHGIIGSCIAVHRELGPGFGERVYENALCVELPKRGLRVCRQLRLPIEYCGVSVGEYVLDLLVAEVVIVELKTVESVHAVHLAQLHSYLRIADVRLGLLINFNVPVLKDGIRRVLNPRRPKLFDP